MAAHDFARHATYRLDSANADRNSPGAVKIAEDPRAR